MGMWGMGAWVMGMWGMGMWGMGCLLYRRDAAEEEASVDVGGRCLIIKKKNKINCPRTNKTYQL